jgi:hypothetical protein
MFSVRRSAVATSVAIAGVLLMSSRLAVSQEPNRESDALSALEQRLRLLQDELARLHEELRLVQDELERTRAAAVHTKRAPEPTPIAEASPPPPPPVTTLVPAPVEQVASSDASACTPPFTVDSGGIKRFRPECLAQTNCETPFVVEAGIKRFRRECLGQPGAAACSPPYDIRDDGIKLIKRECM